MICSCCHFTGRRQSKPNKNFLAEALKDYCIEMNIKQKVRIKIQQMSINIFLNQTLQELANYLFWLIQIKMAFEKGIKPEYIVYYILSITKNYNIIVSGKPL